MMIIIINDKKATKLLPFSYCGECKNNKYDNDIQSPQRIRRGIIPGSIKSLREAPHRWLCMLSDSSLRSQSMGEPAVLPSAATDCWRRRASMSLYASITASFPFYLCMKKGTSRDNLHDIMPLLSLRSGRSEWTVRVRASLSISYFLLLLEK